MLTPYRVLRVFVGKVGSGIEDGEESDRHRHQQHHGSQGIDKNPEDGCIDNAAQPGKPPNIRV